MTTSAVPATPAQWYAQDLIRFQSGPRGSGPRYRYTSVQRLATGFQMTRDTIANIQTKFLDPAIARHNLHRTRPDQPCPSRERTKPAIDEIKRQFPQLMDPRVDATWRERAFHSWILSRLDNFERRKGGIRAKGTKTANGWSSQASSFGTPASGLTPTPSALDVSNPQHQTMTRHNLSLTQTPPYQPESIQQPSEAGSTTWAPPSLLTMVMHFTRPAIPMEDGEEVEADTAAFLLHHCAEREDLHDLGAEAVLMSLRTTKLWRKLGKKLGFDPQDEEIAFWSDAGHSESAKLMPVQDDEALEVAVAIAMHRGEKVVSFEIVAKETVIKGEGQDEYGE